MKEACNSVYPVYKARK